MTQPLFRADDDPGTDPPEADPWHVLVVDDDPDVHAVTRLVLRDTRFDGRPVEIHSAHSAAEARQVLGTRDDFALLMLDVVMETEHAGLDLLKEIREEPRHTTLRVVLRTGQPGQAPPHEVVARYDIDDYCTKTELTFDRLYIIVMTSLRTYRLLKRLESRQQALMESNTELERFAFVASHDLQTPLRGIIGYAQLLARHVGDSLAADDAQLLQGIVHNGQTLHALIQDVLEYSRINRDPIQFELANLDIVIRNAMQALQPMIEERRAVIEIGNLPSVPGVEGQLEQLFRNLIDNGLKYQPGEAPRVEISHRRDGETHELCVRDHGIGIDPKHHDQVFEMFRRLHTQDDFPGTGLGLAICRKIVTLHQGTISVDSTPGQGTTFIVRLPIKPETGA